MAIRYVAKTGSNTSPYDTLVKAATTIQAAANIVNASDEILISEGEYSENLELSRSGAAGNPISVRANPSNTAIVKLTAASGVAVGITAKYWDFYNMVADYNVAGNLVYHQQGSDFIHWYNSVFAGIGRILLYDDAADKADILFSKCRFLGLGGYVLGHSFIGVGAKAHIVVFDRCLWAADKNNYGRPIYVDGKSDMRFFNCGLSGFIASPFYGNSATSKLKIRNSWFVPSDLGFGGGTQADIIDVTAATPECDIDYIAYEPNLVPAQYSGARKIGVADGGHCVENPAWGALGEKLGYADAFWIYTVDDAGTDSTKLTYIQSLWPVFEKYGGKFTWFVDVHNMNLQSGGWAIAQQMVARGHEVGLHSWSHVDLTATTPLTIAGSRTSPTVNIDRAANTITCHDTEGGDRTVTGIKAKLLSAIKAEIDAFTGFTFTITLTNAGNTKGETLADTSGAQACSGAGYAALFLKDNTGATGLFKTEIVDAKAAMETAIGGGYAVKTFAFPGGKHDADVIAAVLASGLLGARETALGNDTLYLSTRKIFQVKTSNVFQILQNEKVLGTFEKASELISRKIYAGAISCVFYAHTAGDFTAAQMDTMLKGTVKGMPAERVTTFAAMIESIRASHTTSDDLVYTKTYEAVAASLLQLDATSLGLIDTGVDVGLVEDYFGNAVPNGIAPDIGLHEYQHPAAGRAWGRGGAWGVLGWDGGPW